MCYANAARKMRIAVGLLAAIWVASPVLSQDAVYPPPKPTPPKIESHMLLLSESVLQIQWPHTLDLVNVPENIALVNPGQCVRVAVIGKGDNRDDYLSRTKLLFSVRFEGHTETRPLAPLAEIKKMKPEGGDFATAALAAGGIKLPDALRTMASLGVSAGQWCAPLDLHDGVATVEATVETPGGRQALTPSTMNVETFETGSKQPFKTSEELSSLLTTYYRQPHPARLLPALRFLVADHAKNPGHGSAEMFAAFLSAAVKADRAAALDLQSRIVSEPPLVRALGLLALRAAGYDVGKVLDQMSAEDKQKFSSLPPLQDPYDLAPTQALPQHLDLLWVTFGATGQFEPVKTIASVLGWRSDYDEFDRLRRSPDRPISLTPSIMRGATYTAAGWSLGSFQRQDPLVADYIDYLSAATDTPAAVKSELEGLMTNPAFKRAGGQ